MDIKSFYSLISRNELHVWCQIWSSAYHGEILVEYIQKSYTIIDQAEIGEWSHEGKFMRWSAIGQFKGADFENRCYTGIYGGHLPHFCV